ncbi:hypothetical protein M8J77_001749 [Diaphorina citri]|nr:hypothetical protein M8J77_001749 [Diaphorina citri]
MAGFTQSALISKLEELNASQQSIQTLSLWLIHHRKHHSTIVKTWIDEVEKADDHRKLTLMYLANDVIQNSKKKGPEYGKEFGHVLKQAFVSVGDVHCSEKTRSSLSRILNIWEERGVYDKQQIASFRTAFNAALEPQTKRRKLSESNTEVLYDVDDRVAAENLSIQVNEAVDLLTNYNTRLVTEMEDRKRASAMLKDYIAAQRELLEQAEQRLEECQSNLEQVCKVREELQSLAHLPMPEKPLPAAGDLFKIRNHQTNSSGGKHQHNSHSKNKKSSRSSS